MSSSNELRHKVILLAHWRFMRTAELWAKFERKEIWRYRFCDGRLTFARSFTGWRRRCRHEPGWRARQDEIITRRDHIIAHLVVDRPPVRRRFSTGVELIRQRSAGRDVRGQPLRE